MCAFLDLGAVVSCPLQVDCRIWVLDLLVVSQPPYQRGGKKYVEETLCYIKFGTTGALIDFSKFHQTKSTYLCDTPDPYGAGSSPLSEN